MIGIVDSRNYSKLTPPPLPLQEKKLEASVLYQSRMTGIGETQSWQNVCILLLWISGHVCACATIRWSWTEGQRVAWWACSPLKLYAGVKLYCLVRGRLHAACSATTRPAENPEPVERWSLSLTHTLPKTCKLLRLVKKILVLDYL